MLTFEDRYDIWLEGAEKIHGPAKREVGKSTRVSPVAGCRPHKPEARVRVPYPQDRAAFMAYAVICPLIGVLTRPDPLIWPSRRATEIFRPKS